MPSLSAGGIGNWRGLKSPTVRSHTGLPAATRTRISPAMRRISEPLMLATIPEMRAAPPAGGVATSALRSCAARTASDMTAQYDTSPRGALSPGPPAERFQQVGQDVLRRVAHAMRGRLVGDTHRERDLRVRERPDPDVVDVIAEAGRAGRPRLH